jgi:hypothetical protein
MILNSSGRSHKMSQVIGCFQVRRFCHAQIIKPLEDVSRYRRETAIILLLLTLSCSSSLRGDKVDGRRRWAWVRPPIFDDCHLACFVGLSCRREGHPQWCALSFWVRRRRIMLLTDSEKTVIAWLVNRGECDRVPASRIRSY